MSLELDVKYAQTPVVKCKNRVCGKVIQVRRPTSKGRCPQCSHCLRCGKEHKGNFDADEVHKGEFVQPWEALFK